MRKYRYKKSYKFKKKKSILRIFRSRYFWLAFLILVALGAVAYAVFISSFFQIKEIKVSGNKKITTEEIISFFGQGNILLVNTKEISREILEKFPQIANLSIKRKLPDILSFQIEERKPVAVFSQDGDYFFIDKEGVIFEKTPGKPPEMLIINGEKEFTPFRDKSLTGFIQKERLEKILKINSKLKDDLGIPFEEILIASKERLNVKTLEGWEIYFNPEGNLDWQLEELAVLLKEKIPSGERENLEYVDLRFDKIFIFPETY